MLETDVLILGAGLAGLSTGYHLERLGGKLSYLVAEKRGVVGGVAGSATQDGFTFDHTGHLLHLHDPYGKELIAGLLKDNLAVHERDSWIYSHGVYTRYPFQANTFGLPPRVVDDCVAGFLKTVHRPARLGAAPSFRDWCAATFGSGISRHFMFPYNEKLWRAPLSRMSTEWQGRFVPKPTAAEVLYGALTDEKRYFGYNAAFRYPVRGGSQALCDALAARVKGVRLGAAVRSVDLRERVAVVDGLGEVRYRKLVNTLPLAAFLDLASPLDAAARSARRRMRWITVHNLNLGVSRPAASGKHWVYFPEGRYPFYRVGWTSNFSPNMAPRGTSSMYIEVSRRPDETVDRAVLERRVLAGLRSCGILRPSDKLLTRLWIKIPCAYVVYDFERTRAVETVLPWLRRRGVESIGRWGAWKYSFMEETILDGKRCAERLLGVAGPAEGPVAQNELKALK